MQTHTTSVTVANLEEWRYNSADAHDIGHGGKFRGMEVAAISIQQCRRIRKNWETALNVATPVPGPASAAKAAVQASAAKGPGKGFGAWPTALPAAEEGLRPDPLTSPSKPIRKNWETALNVATPGPASAAKAAVQASAAKGPGKGFGAWPTALPAAEEGLRSWPRQARLRQPRLRCKHLQPKVPGRALEPGQRPCRLPRRA